MNELLTGVGVAYLVSKLQEQGEAEQDARDNKLARMIADELRGSDRTARPPDPVTQREPPTRVVQHEAPVQVTWAEPTYRVIQAAPLLVSVRGTTLSPDPNISEARVAPPRTMTLPADQGGRELAGPNGERSAPASIPHPQPIAQTPWSDSKPVVVAMLVLVWPVGLYMLWQSRTFASTTKWLVSACYIALFVLPLVVAGFGGKPSVVTAPSEAPGALVLTSAPGATPRALPPTRSP